MNDGPHDSTPDSGQPDPDDMAEQFRKMMQQFGLPMQGDPADFMSQLSQMLQGMSVPGTGTPVGFQAPGQQPGRAGALDWNRIKDLARHVAATKGPDPTPGRGDREALLDASRLAENWLDQACEFAQVAAQPEAWSRAEWIENTFGAWQKVVEPVLTSLTSAMTNLLVPDSGENPQDPMAALGAMMGPLLRQMASMLYGSQLAEGLADLAVTTVSGTEIGLQVLPQAQVVLLPSNIAAAWNDLDLDPRDIEIYLVLREAARQRLFNAVGWLGPQLLALVEHYARGIRIDSSAIEDAVDVDDLSQLTPDKIQELSRRLQGRLFEPTRTPEQEGVLSRLETLLALIEGWVDEVTSQVAGLWMPQHAQLEEAVRRRRATSSPAEAFFSSLLGLQLSPRRVRDAANLWAALRDGRGTVGRDAVWHHPDLMPTAADLDDPLGYVSGESVHNGDEITADLDAELEELLRAEGEDD
ncbi:MAG: zinc-dependent metalloprotease [Acidipropionibacterium jensenii]|nr:zinc-dependent metalloprotease [Acidipropionibacterium jensenii]